MDKLLTEQELVDKIYEITQTMFVTLSEWQAGVTINWESAKIKGRADLLDLTQSQKQAHADMVIGKDKPLMGNVTGNGYFTADQDDLTKRENNLRAEQRERNKL